MDSDNKKDSTSNYALFLVVSLAIGTVVILLKIAGVY